MKLERSLTDTEFRALLSMRMCDDPTCLPREQHDAVGSLLTIESLARGFSSWVVAYHEFNNIKEEVSV